MGINEGLFITTDTTGNVFVAGNFADGTSEDAFVFKYDTSGTRIWHYALTAEEGEYIKGLKLAPNANVIVVFDFFKEDDKDFKVLALNDEGERLFEETFEGRGSDDQQCNSLDIDNNNNIYVTGYCVNNGSKDFVTVKYNNNGDQKWFALFDEKGEDEAIAVKVMGDYIIIAGNVEFTEGQVVKDIVTIGYSFNGIQIWKHRYNGPAQSDDAVTGIFKKWQQ